MVSLHTQGTKYHWYEFIEMIKPQISDLLRSSSYTYFILISGNKKSQGIFKINIFDLIFLQKTYSKYFSSVLAGLVQAIYEIEKKLLLSTSLIGINDLKLKN